MKNEITVFDYEDLTDLKIREGLKNDYAVLIKNFPVENGEKLEKFIEESNLGDWVPYREPATPRSQVIKDSINRSWI